MSDDMVNIEVDGVPMQARRGQMIIEVTDAAAVYVPRFCYHPKLSIAANCRMCLVEVEKAPKPLPACATPVMEGMKVFTRSPRAIAAQKATMEFLLINHPLDCPICDQGGECELQDLAMGYGSDVSRFTERKRIVKDKNLGPLVSTDMTRCIHCTRCVRFGQEIAGIQELGTMGRGENTVIGTYIEHSVDHELSGNIIDVCPVGALNNKPYRYRARAWEMTQHEMVSPHDCVGGQLFTHTLRGKVMRNVPRECEEINETWAADRDRFGCHGLYAEDRLEKPMLRNERGAWEEASWEQALLRVGESFKACAPENMGFLAAPGATLEEHYLLARLARGLGTDNIDHRLQRRDFSSQAADPLLPGLGLPLADVETLDAALVVGSELRLEAPLLAHRLRKAALAGAQVGFVNPEPLQWRFPVAAELVADASALAGRLADVVAAALESGAADLPAELADQLRERTPDVAARRMVEALRGEGARVVWLGLAAQRHPGYAELQVLAAALSRLTGARLGYLGEGANSTGACLAGALPHRAAGGQGVTTPGLHAGAMLTSGLEAVMLLSCEPEHDTAAGEASLASLASAGFVACLTPYATPAMKEYADALLPVGTAYETSGTFVNCAGRWQSFAGAARPVGEARPAWKVLRVLGTQLGLDGFDYMSSEEAREELRAGLETVQVEAPEVPLRAVRLRHAGAWSEPGPYATDMLLRRSRPLQETLIAQAGARRRT
ncbi:NADH-quinone oxidoreductase subunit NuoG [Thioalkalivibrio sp. XN279]|uniref:NADH-quinone oxidoreductase subunit NuoG n=1 Tax=Thioalkalivibrio sp. XN279 TaxID=2714953 RepID=UPI00140E0EEF|nr:NADH-quinone oxidoreductase subunit NuoG [Thioalkalivibrio sp. XN279]NHA14561.1 NADH-quinone oxidoreductase subunit G [Thioalkalivibrio sp. XN279]